MDTEGYITLSVLGSVGIISIFLALIYFVRKYYCRVAKTHEEPDSVIISVPSGLNLISEISIHREEISRGPSLENHRPEIPPKPPSIQRNVPSASTGPSIKFPTTGPLQPSIHRRTASNASKSSIRYRTTIQSKRPSVQRTASNVSNKSIKRFSVIEIEPIIQPTPTVQNQPKKRSYASVASIPKAVQPQIIPSKTFPSIPSQQRKQIKTKTLNSPLLIVVDATPRLIGGYCVDKNNSSLEFYSLPTSVMPWVLRNRSRSGNPNEFEMKNLLCALLLWQHLILRYRKVEIYTDNSAVVGRNRYGRRVRNFISHLEICKNVEFINSEKMYLNRHHYPQDFNNFITPADLLSRGQIDKFLYRVNRVPFTTFGNYPLETKTADFRRVRQKIGYWTKNICESCDFEIEYTGSLKSS